MRASDEDERERERENDGDSEVIAKYGKKVSRSVPLLVPSFLLVLSRSRPLNLRWLASATLPVPAL